ncbi:UDP-4-amino-4,6-dideoxy-N-acetyl-beta-L-altrosamine N-acetyltransferase [Halalkalibacter sp. APA_J-10(15)]|uniref:UDP-4-amino-4, 6-dideoxy-N-acetyl-beta-L-altrosamine N-acetyltransferase n=1 Tax=unclassified Halalkalibacter TaxID=2893063 RepID=UPI001FF4D1E5|nr:UDP-4-amino-4,6-dideoxy-N-acetyl-beta-L-altrosamine N-acetyltransferase [Halalkalibacter sp. APA_J-10(15)]MCK0470515.1 UDP-4-amino-4,6-dideoxy-N-acetyl-beta-L-altrosamine N-acetyltransferase [Halalkalibacter sp. APA_J-10(15)]
MEHFVEYTLTSMKEEHLPLVLKWRNSKSIRQCMYTDHVITLKEHEKWFQKIKQSDHAMIKLLFYRDHPIGLVHFSQIDRRNKKSYWGFYIGEQNAPKGSGTALGFLALECIFEQIGMRKLCSEVLAFNQPSLKFHRKLGFKEEGKFKNHIERNGQYIDVYVFALFNDKWLDVKRRWLNGKGEDYERDSHS